MNPSKIISITSALLSYLDSLRTGSARKDLANQIVNELLNRLNHCTSSISLCDLIREFRDDLEVLIERNPNDPRNSWLSRMLSELHRMEIYFVQTHQYE